MYIFNEFCYKEIHLINMSPLDHVNWDFGAIRGAFCCCVGSLSSFYTAAGCVTHIMSTLSCPASVHLYPHAT